MKESNFRASLFASKDRIILLLISITIAVLVLDISLIKIYSFDTTQRSTLNERILVFITIGVVFASGQVLILNFVKNKGQEMRFKEKIHFGLIHRSVSIIQFLLTVILFFLIFEMVSTSSYNVNILTAAIQISYMTAITMMCLLAKQFFSWFRSKRNTVVLLYALSSCMISINMAFTLAFVSALLYSLPDYVFAHISAGHAPFIDSDALNDILNNGFVISSVLSYLLWWIATAALLYHYSTKLGRILYWTIVGLPLLYFLTQFLPFFFDTFYTFLQPGDFSYFYTLFFTFSKPAAGILFGVAFWTIVKRLSTKIAVRNYMVISAYGLVLLFVSNQAIVFVNARYPPFGLATVSMIGLSSYLVLLGIYSSGISVAQDIELRKSVRDRASRDSELLHTIGTAEMEKEIETKVMKISRQFSEEMTNESGVDPSMDEDELKKYLDGVIEEIKTSKENQPSSLKGKSDD